MRIDGEVMAVGKVDGYTAVTLHVSREDAARLAGHLYQRLAVTDGPPGVDQAAASDAYERGRKVGWEAGRMHGRAEAEAEVATARAERDAARACLANATDDLHLMADEVASLRGERDRLDGKVGLVRRQRDRLKSERDAAYDRGRDTATEAFLAVVLRPVYDNVGKSCYEGPVRGNGYKDIADARAAWLKATGLPDPRAGVTTPPPPPATLRG